MFVRLQFAHFDWFRSSSFPSVRIIPVCLSFLLRLCLALAHIHTRPPSANWITTKNSNNCKHSRSVQKSTYKNHHRWFSNICYPANDPHCPLNLCYAYAKQFLCAIYNVYTHTHTVKRGCGEMMQQQHNNYGWPNVKLQTTLNNIHPKWHWEAAPAPAKKNEGIRARSCIYK